MSSGETGTLSEIGEGEPPCCFAKEEQLSSYFSNIPLIAKVVYTCRKIRSGLTRDGAESIIIASMTTDDGDEESTAHDWLKDLASDLWLHVVTSR